MSAVLRKALAALLTDPRTGAPIGRGERIMLAISMVQALTVIIVLIGGTLGLGAGQ